MLKVGDPVPEFELVSQSGPVKSSDLLGKRYVLYFYPADDTPGCTKEACSFRDHLPRFMSLGVPVYGVSPQDVNSKQKFADKYGLNFPLLADTDHKVAEAFGAWGEKSMYGKKYMGILRTTFVIGADGKVEHVWEKVKPEGHAEEVYRWLNPSAAEEAAPKPEKKAAPAKKKSPAKKK
ncbi:MAG: thioredoxin-dependent thiol peroxidase [Anaerolineae bacterium]|jgi:peroxiredoxin Q/BCP|nr:thioredoxin-dependent thiol peroxidase [Anaerolineae bacterium]